MPDGDEHTAARSAVSMGGVSGLSGGTRHVHPLRGVVVSAGLPSTMTESQVLPFTDDELTELALAADPRTAVADDAVPLSEFLGADGDGDLLPAWYMPAPAGAGRLLQGWRRRVVLLIVASFVLLNAYGLCSTYGYVGFD